VILLTKCFLSFPYILSHLFLLCFIGTVFEPLNLGAPTLSCMYCGALFWYEERLQRDRHSQNPKYNLCCKGGRILLPHYQEPPQPLLNLLTTHSMSLSRLFLSYKTVQFDVCNDFDGSKGYQLSK
jgi:hypothetical protein